MDIEILERKENPSLHREEISFIVNHEGAATPERETVAAKLAAIVNAERALTIVQSINGEFGKNISKGNANIYESEEYTSVERDYILKRNGLLEEEE